MYAPVNFFSFFPGSTHYGYKPTQGSLSYCWVHFVLPGSPADTIKNLPRSSENPCPAEGIPPLDPALQERICLPEHGKISPEKRSQLLFLQLLDLAKRNRYEITWSCHHALNLLLLEMSREYRQAEYFGQGMLPTSVQDIMEWVQSHFDQPLTVSGPGGKVRVPSHLFVRIDQTIHGLSPCHLH